MSRLSVALCVCATTVALAVPARAEDPPEASRSTPLLWTNGEVGYQVANLRTFSANDQTLTVGVLPNVGSGPMVGAGAGVRLSVLTLGLRGRMGLLQGTTPAGSNQPLRLSTIDLELGFHVPFGALEPYFTLAGGYATLGGISSAVNGLGSGLDVSGGNIRVGVGFDYFIERWFSIGAHLTEELIALTRAGVPLRDLAVAKSIGTIDEAKARVMQASGSSLGTASTISAVVGFHFF